MKNSITSITLQKEFKLTADQINALIDDSTITPITNFSVGNSKDVTYLFNETDARKAIAKAIADNNPEDDEDYARMQLFSKNGGTIATDKNGVVKVISTQQNWIAVLKTEYGDNLVSVGEDHKLMLNESTTDTITYKEMPSNDQLMNMAAVSYNLTEPRSSSSNLDSAIAVLANAPEEFGGVKQVNEFEERLKLYESKWDGKSRMAEVFTKRTGSKQSAATLETIAHSWFKGAVHNWVRDADAIPYPMSIDFVSEEQGSGKSMFANMLKGALFGAGHYVESKIAVDLNDPKNAYPQLIGIGVANDDEFMTTNMSKGKRGGTDPDAAIKSVMQQGSFSWQRKQENKVTKVTNRIAWIRSTNSPNAYNGSMTNELERRFMALIASRDREILSLNDYYDYMVQVLGEAYHIYITEGFDPSVDTMMPESIKAEMTQIQLKGSNRSGLYEIMDAMMDTRVPVYFNESGNRKAAVELLSGRSYNTTIPESYVEARDARFLVVDILASALYNFASSEGPHPAKPQVESTVRQWLRANGFIDEPRKDFRYNGHRYKSMNLVMNPANDAEVYDEDAVSHFDVAQTYFEATDPFVTEPAQQQEASINALNELASMSPDEIKARAAEFHALLSKVTSVINRTSTN